MPKRRSPHKRKTKPRPNNLVAKYATRACKAGPMTNQKRALKKGYRKHKSLDYIAKTLISALFSRSQSTPNVFAI